MDKIDTSPVSAASLMLPTDAPMQAKAMFLGERIDFRAERRAPRVAGVPHWVAAGEHGVAILFRYGAAVLFNLSAEEERCFLETLAPSISQPFVRPECETIEICIDAEQREGIENGVVALREYSLERLQVLAVVLSRTVVLAEYEARLAESFDLIEPLAAGLERTGREERRSRQLLKHIGRALLMEHKMVGRLEVQEKPELLWEHPELDPLYQRLAREYELRERHRAIERKIRLISDTVHTTLELLQNRRSLRVEWYIVLLIVFEIALSLYELFFAVPTG